MSDFVKLPLEITFGEKYSPVMAVTSAEEALYRLAQVVEHRQRNQGMSYDAARQTELDVIAELADAPQHRNRKKELFALYGISLRANPKMHLAASSPTP